MTLPPYSQRGPPSSYTFLKTLHEPVTAHWNDRRAERLARAAFHEVVLQHASGHRLQVLPFVLCSVRLPLCAAPTRPSFLRGPTLTPQAKPTCELGSVVLLSYRLPIILLGLAGKMPLTPSTLLLCLPLADCQTRGPVILYVSKGSGLTHHSVAGLLCAIEQRLVGGGHLTDLNGYYMGQAPDPGSLLQSTHHARP